MSHSCTAHPTSGEVGGKTADFIGFYFLKTLAKMEKELHDRYGANSMNPEYRGEEARWLAEAVSDRGEAWDRGAAWARVAVWARGEEWALDSPPPSWPG